MATIETKLIDMRTGGCYSTQALLLTRAVPPTTQGSTYASHAEGDAEARLTGSLRVH